MLDLARLTAVFVVLVIPGRVSCCQASRVADRVGQSELVGGFDRESSRGLMTVGSVDLVEPL